MSNRPWLLAACIFLVAYLPFALSGQYEPLMYGTLGRINGMGAWAFGLAVALMIRRGGVAAGVGVLVLALSLCASRNLGGGWLRAAEAQRQILKQVRIGHADGVRKFILSERSWDGVSGAPIFIVDWDWPYAVRYVTGDEGAVGEFAE